MSVSFMYPLCLRCGPRGSFWFSSGLPSERSPPLSTLSYFWPGISTLHVPNGAFLKVSYVTPYFILPHYYQPSWCSPSDGQGCGVSACVVLVVFLCFPVPFSFFLFYFIFFIFLFFSFYIVTKDSRSTKLGISSPLVLPEGGVVLFCNDIIMFWFYFFSLMNAGACSSHCTCADAAGLKVAVMSPIHSVTSFFVTH